MYGGERGSSMRTFPPKVITRVRGAIEPGLRGAPPWGFFELGRVEPREFNSYHFRCRTERRSRLHRRLRRITGTVYAIYIFEWGLPTYIHYCPQTATRRVKQMVAFFPLFSEVFFYRSQVFRQTYMYIYILFEIVFFLFCLLRPR